MKQKYENNELHIVAVEKRGFHGYPMMYHSHIEILCVMDGSIKVNINAVEYTLERGQFCVVFPYVLHSYEDAPNTRFRLIMVSAEYLSGFETMIPNLVPENPILFSNSVTDLLMEKTIYHMHHDNVMGEQTACAYATALMGEILCDSKLIVAKNPASTAAKNLLIYCNEYFAQNITVSSAATACFISESLVSKIFAKEIGCSFRTYINKLRIGYARQLLKKTDMNIIDIMYACGFQNQSSFNRIFYSLCQETPRQYRVNSRKSL